MSKTPKSPPPELTRYEYKSYLGGGGFADVFLYRDLTLGRDCAIKVLRHDVRHDVAQMQFKAEATVMARVSQHPHIVSIYSTDLSPDGRPYIAMEFCKASNYGERYRSGALSVQEVLSVGVKMAGAVEYAHRAGIVHRDIKPDNILTSDFGPALADFGISALLEASSGGGTGVQEDTSLLAVSLPWSAPESHYELPDVTTRSDIFSLAATIYTLLQGSSPFVVPGANMTRAQLAHRIQNEPLPPFKRADIPEELFMVLQTAMAKDPKLRYRSSAAFGRALNSIEAQMQFPLTDMHLPATEADAFAPSVGGGASPEAGLDEGTQMRPNLTFRHTPTPTGATPVPQPAPAAELYPGAGTAPAAMSAAQLQFQPVTPSVAPTQSSGAYRSGDAPQFGDTMLGATEMRSNSAPAANYDTGAPSPRPESGSAPKWRWWALGAAGLVVVVALGLVVKFFILSPTEAPTPDPIATSTPRSSTTEPATGSVEIESVPVFAAPPTVTLVVNADKTRVVTVKWKTLYPDPDDTLQYKWAKAPDSMDNTLQSQGLNEFKIKVPEGIEPSLLVNLSRNGQVSQPITVTAKSVG